MALRALSFLLLNFASRSIQPSPTVSSRINKYEYGRKHDCNINIRRARMHTYRRISSRCIVDDASGNWSGKVRLKRLTEQTPRDMQPSRLGCTDSSKTRLIVSLRARQRLVSGFGRLVCGSDGKRERERGRERASSRSGPSATSVCQMFDHTVCHSLWRAGELRN